MVQHESLPKRMKEALIDIYTLLSLPVPTSLQRKRAELFGFGRIAMILYQLTVHKTLV
jgi:hypothetical protein